VTIKKTMGPARAHSTRPPRRYPSDLTDAQWQVITVHLPPDQPGRRGRPRIWPLRRIIEAILYLDRTGCPWRYLPADFPPWQTVYWHFAAWRDGGTLTRLHTALRTQVRTAAGRHAEPTAAVIDSQSVRAADTVPKATRGWDNAKKVNGHKRHIAVDTTGLVLAVVITAASVQDRDGRPATAVEPAPRLHQSPAGMGRRRIHRGQADRLGRHAENHHRGRGQAQPAHLRSTAPPLGGGKNIRLDQQAPPHRPRLRAPALKPRSHDLVGHDRLDDPPPHPASLISAARVAGVTCA
jgi:putative transposase